jgi:hypothetical protein
MRIQLLLTVSLGTLAVVGCGGDDSPSTTIATDSTESSSGDGDGDTGDGDGDTGDGDGDTGDGDGDTGDGDGDTGDGDGEPGDGDGDTGDGDGEPGDGDGDTGDGDGDSGDGDGDGDGDPLDCDAIVSQYNMLAEGSSDCMQDDDCHVVDGHCWMGLGGCWYVVNQSLKQGDLDALANQYQGAQCFGPICACIMPPVDVGCVDGTCMEL